MVLHTQNGNGVEPIGLVKHQTQRGFTYIGVLVIMTCMLMAMGAASEVWHTVMQQEKERELIFIGHQFRTAIRQYYLKFGNKYPPSLDALVETDDPSGNKAHFLRKLYLDPITNNTQWGTVQAQNGGVAGVFSISEDMPLKAKGFADIDAKFENAEKYSDWKFVFVPRVVQGASLSGSVVNGIVRPVPRVR
jgi:type II secretory pathway pseudopilin PulG